VLDPPALLEANDRRRREGRQPPHPQRGWAVLALGLLLLGWCLVAYREVVGEQDRLLGAARAVPLPPGATALGERHYLAGTYLPPGLAVFLTPGPPRPAVDRPFASEQDQEQVLSWYATTLDAATWRRQYPDVRPGQVSHLSFRRVCPPTVPSCGPFLLTVHRAWPAPAGTLSASLFSAYHDDFAAAGNRRPFC
jgi:hypothetical protein